LFSQHSTYIPILRATTYLAFRIVLLLPTGAVILVLIWCFWFYGCYDYAFSDRIQCPVFWTICSCFFNSILCMTLWLL